MKIVIATNNKGKVAEIKEILSTHQIMSQSEAGIHLDAEETGSTFVENALIKARAIKEFTDCAILADDSGLVVESLGGEPGLYSSRYAGEGCTPDQCIDKLLNNMKDLQNRNAYFISVVALIMPDGSEHIFEGRCEGEITYERKGNGGFGYDPVFYVKKYNKTFSEMGEQQKNKISHRYKALQKAKEFLEGEQEKVESTLV